MREHAPDLQTNTKSLPREGPTVSRSAALRALLPGIEAHLARGGRLNNVTRHILGLYYGAPRARAFRRYLSENAGRDGADGRVLEQAIALVESRSADFSDSSTTAVADAS